MQRSCIFADKNCYLTDNEVPTVTCPSDNTTNVDPGMAGAVVFWSVSPNASDVVDATVNANSVVCENNLGLVVTSGVFFQEGVTTVTCRANDTSLNEGMCSFLINVTGKYFFLLSDNVVLHQGVKNVLLMVKVDIVKKLSERQGALKD